MLFTENLDKDSNRTYRESMLHSEMAEKIDAVLERVKEPESNLSIAQLGLVKRVRYNTERNTLYVFTNTIKSNHHYCCTIIQGLLVSSTIERLTEEFHKEFPDLSIEFV
jgi:metal-sulfur cluster biosynthetic enzyme